MNRAVDVKTEDSGLEDVSDEEEADDEVGEDDDDDDDEDADWETDEDGEDVDEEGEEDVEEDGAEEDDDDDDDDDESEDVDEEEAVLEASDSDAEDTERCPICLDRFQDQDVGTPESCDHTFCLECILEWSKNVNTCPADRQVFHLILCKHGVDDVIYKKIPVEDINTQAEDEEDEPVYCEVCNESDREDHLLLCDSCDKGYHLECLTPPLSEVPVDEWFCPRCARKQEPDPDYVAETTGRRRRIARTLVSERVRSAIEQLRVTRARNIQKLIESDEDEKNLEGKESSSPTAAVASTSSSTTRTRPKRTPAKKKTPRKYKKKRRKTKTATKKKKTRRRRRKKTGKKTKTAAGKKKKRKAAKKRARTAPPVPVTTPKSRIAGTLGLSKPPPGRTIPLQKMKQEKSLEMKRGDIGADSLSIFGSRDELIHFDDDQSVDNTEAFNSDSSSGTRKYSRLALSSYRPIGRVPALPAVQKQRATAMKSESSAATGGPLDLLSSIMQGQDRLNMSSKDITIQRDGSLTAHRKEWQQDTKSSSKSSGSSSSSALFKSSFRTVGNSSEKASSLLPKHVGEQTSESEEYDPAHPTDDLEEDSQEEIEAYDPAHPTEDMSNSEDEMILSDQEDKNLFENSAKKEVKENSLSYVKQSFGVFPLDKRSTKIEFSIKSNLISDRTKKQTPEKEESKVHIKPDKLERSKSIEAEKVEGKLKASETVAATASVISVSANVKDSTESQKSQKATTDSSAVVVANTSSESLNIPKMTKVAEPKSADKTTTDSNEKKVATKISPSVKITESSKKSQSTVKPFEISRKALFEKKRLYGGEIDFTEDVDFSEGAFPDTFEISVKKIEEVFKDTRKKQETQHGEKELDKTDTHVGKVNSESNCPVVKEGKVESNDIGAVKQIEHKGQNKQMPESGDTIRKEDKQADKDHSGKKAESSQDRTKEKPAVAHEVSKDDVTKTDKSKGKTLDKEEKSKSKLNKENKDKIQITLEKADAADEYTGITKLSVSDRFKKIKERKKESGADDNLEEEDPIHEMRKLDKELELEFGNTALLKRKDKEKEGKKTKRKISLDELEKENLKLRKDLKDKRKYSQDDREEGEVEDEVKLKDKRRKEKKRRKSEKGVYYSDDYLEPGESDIDRRIVIQVSQNNDDRTVWEEAERQRRKKDRENRRKEKDRRRDSDREYRREKKHRRGRSRSMSHERRKRSRSRERRSTSWSRERSRDRSRDRDRSRERVRSRDRDRSRDRVRSRDRDRSRERVRSRDRDKSRERSRRKRRDRSHSHSRDDSLERIKKKKKRNRSKEREKESSRDWNPIRSRDRDWSKERDWSAERIRENQKSRELSEDDVDIFGRSKSPFVRKEILKEKKNLSQRKKIKKERIFDPDEVIIIDSPSSPQEESKYEEVSSESEKGSPERENESIESTDNTSKKDNKGDSSPQVEQKEKIEPVSRIEPVCLDRGQRDSPPQFEESEEKEEDEDDEPEETEQFQYTDREEFLGQNKSSQMRQNLITIGVSSDPSRSSVLTPPPLPEAIPTPPLPPPGGDFAQFPPPPPGPPPQGPPPGTVILQDRPLHLQPPGGPPGQGILGERPILIQGPPPSLESGPASMIQQRPTMSVPVNINVLPPGFHRGLPPTIAPQRQVLVSPLRPSGPALQRLQPPPSVRLGWQVNSPEILSGQFPPRIPSPGGLTRHPVINGPFEGLPSSHAEALPPHSLPPGSINLPPPGVAHGEPSTRVIAIKTDSTPHTTVVQVPLEVNEASRHMPPPPGPDAQLLPVGPDLRGPPPRLPIPLLPTVSEPPPMSDMVSVPPPNPVLNSVPAGSIQEPFSSANTPSNSVSAILGLARIGTSSMPVVSSTVIPGLQMATSSSTASNMSSAESTLTELEKISELLSTQAHLMAMSKEKTKTEDMSKAKENGVFKVPLAPAGKVLGKNGVDATEVVDMEIGSPINEEGNIELPVSPQFDNLIDNPEDLLEEDFNKKMKKSTEKDKPVESDKDSEISSVKNKVDKDMKEQDGKKDSARKSKDEKRSTKENKHGHHHKSRKHRSKPEADKNLAEKALKDAQLDLEAQDVPSSAVEMTNKEKYLKKLHLQERVVEEVKMAIKPFYSGKKISKEQYKEILRKAVPKICHSKSGNINPMKIKKLVEAYVEKYTKNSDHSDTPDKKDENSPGFDKIMDLPKTKAL